MAYEAISGMPACSEQNPGKSRPADDLRLTETETWLEIPLLCLCGSALCCILSVYKLSHEVLFIILQDWSWLDFVTRFPLCMCSYDELFKLFVYLGYYLIMNIHHVLAGFNHCLCVSLPLSLLLIFSQPPLQFP